MEISDRLTTDDHQQPLRTLQSSHFMFAELIE